MSLIQGPFSVAPCHAYRNLFIAVMQVREELLRQLVASHSTSGDRASAHPRVSPPTDARSSTQVVMLYLSVVTTLVVASFAFLTHAPVPSASVLLAAAPALLATGLAGWLMQLSVTLGLVRR